MPEQLPVHIGVVDGIPYTFTVDRSNRSVHGSELQGQQFLEILQDNKRFMVSLDPVTKLHLMCYFSRCELCILLQNVTANVTIVLSRYH